MNISFLFWNNVDEDLIKQPKPQLDRQCFSFWPAGGGSLDYEQKPMLGYYIAGSWTQWEPVLMEEDADGNWTSTVKLGENNYEKFQLLLDEDPERVLHPGVMMGLSGSAVQGPAPGTPCKWVIDGRDLGTALVTPAIEDGGEAQAPQ